MGVLSATVLALVLGVLLSVPITGGEQDALIRVFVLAMAHLLAGWMSWTASYQGWASRLCWMSAITTHTLTYTLNWELYAVSWGALRAQYPGMTLLNEGQANTLQSLVIVGVIVLPSIMMYGGPFRAILRPPPPAPTEDDDE